MQLSHESHEPLQALCICWSMGKAMLQCQEPGWCTSILPRKHRSSMCRNSIPLQCRCHSGPWSPGAMISGSRVTPLMTGLRSKAWFVMYLLSGNNEEKNASYGNVMRRSMHHMAIWMHTVKACCKANPNMWLPPLADLLWRLESFAIALWWNARFLFCSIYANVRVTCQHLNVMYHMSFWLRMHKPCSVSWQFPLSSTASRESGLHS